MERIIRPIQLPADHADFEALSRQAYGDETQADPQFLAWALTQNPDQGGAPTLFGTMWEGEQMIASDGLIPCRISIDGRRFRAADDVMSITHSDFQRQGIFSTMTKNSLAMAEENGIDLVVGLANRNSAPAYAKFGFEVLWEKNALVKPIDVTDSLARKLRIRPIAAGANAAWRWVDDRVGRRAQAAHDVEVSQFVPPEAGEFWDRIEHEFDVALVRDAARLEYRYNARPDAQYTTIMLRRDDEVVGFAIFRERTSAHSRLLSVVEFVTSPCDASAMRALAAAVTDEARERGVAYVSMCTGGFGRFQQVLLTCGFAPIELVSERTMIAKILNPAIRADMIRGYERWHLSQGDLETDY